MTIITREPLTKEEQQKIADIWRESNCPHESLRNIRGYGLGIRD